MPGFFSPSQLSRGGRKLPLSLPKCGRCGLYKRKQTRNPKLPPHKGTEPVLFVVDGPTKDDDEDGSFLASDGMEFLESTLRSLGHDLQDFNVTGALICRIPKDITDDQIACCRPNLLKAIRELKPRVIIPLGKEAVRAVLPMERLASIGKFSRWVGWRIPFHENGAWICPTYSPRYVISNKDAVLRVIFERHIKRALRLRKRALKESYTLEALKSRVEVIRSPKSARKRLRGLLKKSGRLAFDYETTGLKPESRNQREHEIVSCSFCLEGEDTFAIPVGTDEKTLRLLSKVLKRKKLKKIASNMKFEERWTMAKLGHRVAGWDWDTMLAAHVLDNRSGITSVKFLSFVYFGVADFNQDVEHFFRESDPEGFNRIKEIPIEDLLLYNGLDSLLEFMVMEKQRRLFE